MTQVESLARFIGRMAYQDLSAEAQQQLKIGVLDSLGRAIGALEGDPVRAPRSQIDEFGSREGCTLVGGGKTAPDRAALYHTALVRYLDFMDSFLANGRPAIRATTSAPCLPRPNMPVLQDASS